MTKQLYLMLEEPKETKWGTLLQLFIFANIIINIVVLSLDTVNDLHLKYGGVYELIEIVTVSIFIIELITRYLVIGHDIRYKDVSGKFKYTFTFYTLIDIMAILPFVLAIFGVNTSFLRVFRLMRVFKLFRAAKATKFDRVIRKIFHDEKEEFIIVFSVILIILIFFTVLVYFAESSAQPEVFSSIPQTLWWAVVTLTTVGYGDMYPITTIGRILTGMITMLGIAFYAVPGSLFTAALIKQIDDDEETAL